MYNKEEHNYSKKPNLFSKIKLFFTNLWIGFFMGLKKADMTIKEEGNKDGQGDEQQLKGGNVFSDMLDEKVTKEVEVERDKNYRVYREAGNYNVTITGGFDSEGNDVGDISAIATKKTGFHDTPRTEILQTPRYEVALVQDEFIVENGSDESGIPGTGEETFTFNFTYKETPKFILGHYVKRIVLKKTPKGTLQLDMYVSQYARQFKMIDSLFLSELKRIREEKGYPATAIDFDTVEFVTHKAWGFPDLHRFRFKNKKFKGMEEFDGNHVLKYEVKEEFHEDIVEKYHTDELDEYYAKNAPKNGATFHLGNNVEKIDLSNENSN